MRKMDKWYWVGTSPYIFERILLDYCLRVYQTKGKWGWEVRKVNWTEEMNKRMKNPDLPSFSLEFHPGITVISGNASTVIRAAEMAELAVRVRFGNDVF
jgi:nitrate reductase gamma subunit